MNTRLEELKNVIEEEYQRMELDELVGYLYREYQLDVRSGALKNFLRKHNIKKNNEGEFWVWADDEIKKRKLQGKDSDLFIRDKLVTKKIRVKEIARHVNTEAKLKYKNDPTRSAPPRWVVRSPEVEVVDADTNASIASTESQIGAQPTNQVPMWFKEFCTSIENSIHNERELNPMDNETPLDENLEVFFEASHTHNGLISNFDIQFSTLTVEQLIRGCRVIFSHCKIAKTNIFLRYVKVVYAPHPSVIAGPVLGFKKKFYPNVFEHALDILGSCCSYRTRNAQSGHPSSDTPCHRVGAMLWSIQDVQLRFKVFGAALTLTACQRDPKPVEILKYHADERLSASAIRHVLFICSSQGNIDLLSLFWRLRFDLDSKLADGTTALYIATVYNQVEIVKFLLRRGINVNATASDGRTAFATVCNLPTHTMVCQLLTKRGEDMNMTEEDERPAASQATSGGIDSQGTESTSRLRSYLTVVDQSIVESLHAATRDQSGEPGPHRKSPASPTASESQLYKPSAKSLCAYPNAEPDRSKSLPTPSPLRVSRRQDENSHYETPIANGMVEPKNMLTAEALRFSDLVLSLADEDNISNTSSLVSRVLPPITSSLGRVIEAQSESSWPLSEVNALFSGSMPAVSKTSLVEDVTPKPQIRRMNSPNLPEVPLDCGLPILPSQGIYQSRTLNPDPGGHHCDTVHPLQIHLPAHHGGHAAAASF